MAGVWQWTQPWVWTILVMPAPVPPIGNLLEPAGNFLLLRSSTGFHLGLAVHHELDVVPGGESQVPVAVLVRDFADLPDDVRRS